MLFDVKVKMPDDSIDCWTYDTKDNELKSERFGDINPKIVPCFIPIKPFSAKDTIIKDLSKIDWFEINTGFHCNFSCTYCPQKGHADDIHSARKADIPEFIEKLKKAKENGLNPKRIKLWGGEPLVYWKVLKELIPEVTEVFNSQDVIYSLTTNGVLLTNEIVDTLAQYNVWLNVSHDGCCDSGGSKNTDILKDPKLKEVIAYASKVLGNHFVFMNVITKENPNIVKTLRWFQQEMDDSNIKIAPVMYKWNDANKDISPDFPEQVKEQIVQGVYDGLTNEDTVNHIYHISNYYKFLHRVAHREPIETCKYYCENQDIGIICDLKGNVYNCKIRLQKTGTLENINEIPSTNNIHWWYRKDCPECPVIQVCGGGCVRQKDGWEHGNTCKNSYYPFHLGMFKAAFKKLFNVEVLEISKSKQNA